MAQTPQYATQAELAFIRELLGDFYATQIDAGAVLRDEIAAHIRAAADRAARAHPYASHTVEAAAAAMIAALPEGYASGENWQDPA